MVDGCQHENIHSTEFDLYISNTNRKKKNFVYFDCQALYKYYTELLFSADQT